MFENPLVAMQRHEEIVKKYAEIGKQLNLTPQTNQIKGFDSKALLALSTGSLDMFLRGSF